MTVEIIEFNSFLAMQIDSGSKINQISDSDSNLATTVTQESLLNKTFIIKSVIELEEV